ncbi:PhzF family phenazine biosynthesis protein [Synechococcus sp. BSF8S]|uniref:PhzF family phenazine biosynthesis protein n=1 Tax=Synechococcales TaxID=1890424 RepID=UPI00162613E6|nr:MULTISPECIES: PhzF family phenazine biosynthesis protein [unclassified Synechococcus]MBC1260184.1 PhzF family phenazine biosynthesis protein [Synechococcus sp. BSF8S]MBC1262999.1 PhzF family phenazine biosynthesis protein [Synechococcus sp. BSA11S]
MNDGGLPAVLITAFAERPLQGNGAAVVALARPASSGWMQAVAAQLRQSETAFLLPLEGLLPEAEAAGEWALRWFTPSCEVPLCGHATLASALALGHWGLLQPGGTTRLHSRSGPLLVSLSPAAAGCAQLVLPSAGLEPSPLSVELGPLLGMKPLRSWRSALGYRVALLPPDFDLPSLDGDALAGQLSGELRQGLVLMQALGDSADAPALQGLKADYQLRFLAPGLGINEDPVTGSAHALVAPWWCDLLGRERVVGWQPSPRGGGMVCDRLSSGMIRLSGSGQLLWDGRLSAGVDAAEPVDWSCCLPGPA